MTRSTIVTLVAAVVFYLNCSVGEADGQVTQNPCSNHRWRFNPQACLNFIKESTDDPDLYWFGNQFTKNGCTFNDAQTYLDSFVTSRLGKCLNPRPLTGGIYLTLGSRLFMDNDYKSSSYLTKLNSLLEVQFVSPPEMSYSGCNTTAQLPTTTVIDVYPGMPAVPAIMVRKAPRLSPIGCNFNQLCTIIFYDAGNGVVHNVWTNWPKENNFTDYVKPGTPSLNPNPYVIMAYFQKGEIANFNARDILPLPYNFSIVEFAKAHDLQGPFAINWLNVVTDISAQDVLVQAGFINRCPLLLEELSKQDIVIINKDLGISHPFNVDVWLAVEYKSESITYESCCNKFQTEKKEIWVDSLRNGRIALEHVRNKPEITLQSTLLFPDTDDFKDQKFTLMLVQPDISLMNPTTGQINSAETFVYWMIYNIVDGQINSGIEKLTYLEPMPTPQRPANRFYFLLLNQTDVELDSTKIDNYTTVDCGPTAFSRRCRFPLTRFARENNMKLIGASRFRIPETAVHQPFVRHLWVKYNVTTEGQACFGAPNYPCANNKELKTLSLGINPPKNKH